MKLPQAMPVLALCLSAATQAQAISACKDKDNTTPCTIELAGLRLNHFSPPRCMVFLREIRDHVWVGFSAETDITWTINKTIPDQLPVELVDIVFDNPSKFVLTSSTGDSRKYTFKQSTGDSGKDYKYTVKAKVDGISCEPLDPWVRNQ